ncbi:putative DNA modification/repair radical SAM protein [Psychrobacter phenylpyruvicus]|uniref:Putative DNA modification/repair radical SAM protein n=1 Tax=Psychrobacter phenylpyruvicus TaxID=29432 RepID=A0A379LJF2_9GAMM|nr:putative DNA modification/repair radical SAM protein [Psychrobacter phenylpyruvicus]SUD90215.1 putative DNA modification/repair radical SAM protein [Psychrobacter phenylpyruvicus]
MGSINYERLQGKLNILADAAKYDVSCSSSGSTRKNQGGSLGDASKSGICHSYTEDGRCVSLLKILLTNHCIYDCAYCTSRRSNDTPRAAFTVEEVVELTMQFYRRNYIEGLFLSSGIFKDGDYTMERLVEVAKLLRTREGFNGYIHLKTIPGASKELLYQAGLYADRLSANIEIPTKSGLALLAPEKSHDQLQAPLQTVKEEIITIKESRKKHKSAPKFTPAGQTSQMIVGASNETDLQVIQLSSHFYQKYDLKRVYYSGYVPMLSDSRLPAVGTPVPMVRENRLYQADWLMRFYGFGAHEILEPDDPFLDLECDPKLAWAIRHREHFPVNIQTAPYEAIIRIPGIGIKTAKKIVKARRFNQITLEHLKKMGAAVNRAKYFIATTGKNEHLAHLTRDNFRQYVLAQTQTKFKDQRSGQLALF